MIAIDFSVIHRNLILDIYSLLFPLLSMQQNTVETTVIRHPVSASLRKELDTISDKCINCKLCQKECEFLRKYGKPKEIADSYDPSDKAHQGMPFECSLCQLCAAVCPVKINPSAMFLEMRREAVRNGSGDYPEHAGIVGYEKRGTSKKFSYYTLPKGCDTIFFPGLYPFRYKAR